jgi:hypothetical protein
LPPQAANFQAPKSYSPKCVEGEFCEVRTSALRSSTKFGRFLGEVQHFVLLDTYTSPRQEYDAFVTWAADAA